MNIDRRVRMVRSEHLGRDVEHVEELIACDRCERPFWKVVEKADGQVRFSLRNAPNVCERCKEGPRVLRHVLVDLFEDLEVELSETDPPGIDHDARQMVARLRLMAPMARDDEVERGLLNIADGIDQQFDVIVGTLEDALTEIFRKGNGKPGATEASRCLACAVMRNA